jgi:hypothetical protein
MSEWRLETAKLTLDLVITGGTGLFAGDTGEATSLQMIMSTSPTTGAGSGTYAGTLSNVPEPSSLALLAPAALFVFYRRRRRAMAGLPSSGVATIDRRRAGRAIQVSAGSRRMDIS